MSSTLNFDTSLNNNLASFNRRRFDKEQTPFSSHNYFVLNKETQTLTTRRDVEPTDADTTDLYEISLFAQQLLNQEIEESSPSACLICNVLSLNSSIRSYNNKIDAKVWLQALHIIFAVLTLGIFRLKNHLYIQELKLDIEKIKADGSLPISFYVNLDPVARETLLETIPGYEKFKNALGDKILLLLERLALVEQSDEEPLCLEKLLEQDPTTFSATIFVKTEKEIAETPLSELSSPVEWSYLCSLGKEKLEATPREAGEAPRVADLAALTKEEFLSLFSKQFETFTPYLQNGSLWSLFSFALLKEFTEEEFTKFVEERSLFSAEIASDRDLFFEMSLKQQQLYFIHGTPSPQFIEFLFPEKSFSYEILAQYSQECWPCLLRGIGNRLANFRAEQLNKVVSALTRLDCPLADYLEEEQLKKLDANLWTNSAFLLKILSTGNAEQVKAFLGKIPATTLAGIKSFIVQLDMNDPLKKAFDPYKQVTYLTTPHGSKLGFDKAVGILRKSGLGLPGGPTPTPKKNAFFFFSLSDVADPKFNEACLARRSGYAQFKAACGDKSILVLRNFASIGSKQTPLWTLEELFAMENVGQTLFAKTAEELVEAPLLEIRNQQEWLYLFSLDPAALVAKTARTADSLPRIGDMKNMTSAELAAFRHVMTGAKCDFKTLIPKERSLWDFLPFERLKELSAEDFKKFVSLQTAFSPNDESRFRMLSQEQREVYLLFGNPSKETLEAFFSYELFCYKMLTDHPNAWIPLLGRFDDQYFGKLDADQRNSVATRIAQEGLDLPMILLLDETTIPELSNDLWKNESFLNNLFGMGKRENERTSENIDRCLKTLIFPHITASQYETMREFIEGSNSDFLKEQYNKIARTYPPLTALLEDDFKEISLEGLDGYKRFKEQCGDRASRILRNFAEISLQHNTGETLQILFSVDLRDSFLGKTETEIADTPIPVSQYSRDTFYFFSLDPKNITPSSPKTAPLRFGDLSSITKEELKPYIEAMKDASRFSDWATMLPEGRSLWDFIPFERIQELSNDEFQIVLQSQSLFSPKAPKDIGRFLSLSPEKQLLLLEAKKELIPFLLPRKKVENSQVNQSGEQGAAEQVEWGNLSVKELLQNYHTSRVRGVSNNGQSSSSDDAADDSILDSIRQLWD